MGASQVSHQLMEGFLWSGEWSGQVIIRKWSRYTFCPGGKRFGIMVENITQGAGLGIGWNYSVYEG